MHPIEAIRRFALWPDRTDLRRRVTDKMGDDRWPEAATAACKIAGHLESASTDDDLRAGLREFESQRNYRHRLMQATMEITAAHSGEAGRPVRVAIQIKPEPIATPPAVPPRLIIPAGLELRIVSITPRMAVRLFAMSSHIAMLADKMARGEWSPSDERVRVEGCTNAIWFEFNPDDEGCYIANGNNRLRAIALANVTVTTEVLAPPAIFDRIEQIRAELTAAETNRSNHDGNP